MNGGVPSKELNEELLNILNELEQDISLLNDHDYIQHIRLLQVGADPNLKNQDGKTLSDYSSEKLRDILNKLAIDRSLLDNPYRTKYIMFFLETGANPNIQNQDRKTLLHYVAERNDIKGIEYLLGVKANPSIRDQSGKTPFEYVTEPNCLQALKCLGYDLDDSHENEGNSATPDGSVDDCSNSSGDDSQIESIKLSDCNTEEDSDYHSDGSCENEENPANNSSNYPNKHNDDQTLRDDPGYSSGDDNKTISTEPSDCDRKDEDSSCSSSDYLFLEDSLLAKLEIPLTTDEQKLIDKFCEKIRGITAQNKQESEESILKSIEETVNNHLNTGARINSLCCDKCKSTVTNLIFEEIDNVLSSNHLRLRDETGARERQSDGIADQDDDNEDKVSGIIKRIAFL